MTYVKKTYFHILITSDIQHFPLFFHFSIFNFTSSHVHIFTFHIFTSSHFHIFISHIFTPSHLPVLTSSHYVFTSSQFSHLQVFTSSHLYHIHIFISHIFDSQFPYSHPYSFTSSRLPILASPHPHVFTSSQFLHPHAFSSSHFHIFTFI